MVDDVQAHWYASLECNLIILIDGYLLFARRDGLHRWILIYHSGHPYAMVCRRSFAFLIYILFLLPMISLSALR